MALLRKMIDPLEGRIKQMKTFYQGLGLKRVDRQEVLNGLTMFIGEFSSMIDENLRKRSYSKKEATDLAYRVNEFLKTYLAPSASLSFLNVQEPPKQLPFGKPDGALIALASAMLLAQDVQHYSEEHHYWQKSQQLNLQYLVACIKSYGLHPDIERRDHQKFARYNVVITFTSKNAKRKVTERRRLVSKTVLDREYIIPYANERSLLINGKKNFARSN